MECFVVFISYSVVPISNVILVAPAAQRRDKLPANAMVAVQLSLGGMKMFKLFLFLLA